MTAVTDSVKVPLDDVMLSMDVVDTLRHREDLVERELNDEARRKRLIERLREVYRGQGIEVPDHILEAGVKALEEKRFVYEPPRASLSVTLARLYVTRWQWGRVLGMGLLVLGLGWFAWQVGYVWPRTEREAAARIELSETLPQQLNAAFAAVEREARTPLAVERAKALRDAGLSAASSGQAALAREALAGLNALLDQLREVYEIKVVSRPGELSGLWRIPKVNPNSRNYYLVVEAVDSSGNVLERPVINEETGRRETVRLWAVRVAKSAFDAVQADKLDDGIIQKAVIGVKQRGELEPRWQVDTLGGALTQW